MIETSKLRAVDPFWKELYWAQTVVKASVGLGKPIYVNFVAPVNHDDLDRSIKFDYKRFKSDSQWSVEQYWLKQAYKIAFYVSKIHCYEILSMKLSFLRDENK